MQLDVRLKLAGPQVRLELMRDMEPTFTQVFGHDPNFRRDIEERLLKLKAGVRSAIEQIKKAA